VNRTDVTITYVGGLEKTVTLRPVVLVATERHFAGNIPPVEGTLWATWYSLQVPASFADWLESIDAVSETTGPPISATLAAPSPPSPIAPA